MTLRYVDGRPVGATSIVVSTQHDEGLSQHKIKSMLLPIIQTSLPEGWMPSEDDIYINPTGTFVVGGPDGDCGLTGRKIIVDTYGGAAPPWRRCLQRQGPDEGRSVGRLCLPLPRKERGRRRPRQKKCTIQISYAIGVSHPLSVYVDLHGTGRDVSELKLEQTLRELVNLSPRGIREHLHLNRPIYVPTSAYGHFGPRARRGARHLHLGAHGSGCRPSHPFSAAEGPEAAAETGSTAGSAATL